MPKFMEGVVTVAQEGRFQLTDDHGVGHLFILGHLCGTEPGCLPALQRRQARIRVKYAAAPNMIAYVAHAISEAA